MISSDLLSHVSSSLVRTDWGDEPTVQPTARCVAHLMSVILRTMEEGSSGTDNLELTPAEVADWLKKNVTKH